MPLVLGFRHTGCILRQQCGFAVRSILAVGTERFLSAHAVAEESALLLVLKHRQAFIHVLVHMWLNTLRLQQYLLNCIFSNASKIMFQLPV